MIKENVKNYRKPKFLLGAAAAAVAFTGCSREPLYTGDTGDVAAADTTADIKTTAEEPVQLDGDVAVNVTEEATVTGQTSEVELEGEITAPTESYPELQGMVQIANPGISEAKDIPSEQLMALNEFSVELFKKSTLESVKNNENVLVSPESVYLALGLLANGGAGDTATEIIKAIAGTENMEAFNELMSYFVYEKSAQMSIANSIWINNAKDYLKVNPEYLCKLSDYFQATAYEENLPESVDKINNWIKSATDGMIDHVVDELYDDIASILINAIAFDAKWAQQYEDYQVTENEKFTDANGNTDSCTMLNGCENTYIYDLNTTGFLKYYEGNRYAFMAMLPDEGISIEDYIAELTGEKISDLLTHKKSAKNIQVSTKTPKFTYDYERSMLDDIRSLGMEKAMSTEADYSNMFEGTDLYVSDILHKTHIELSESGTKAAAVTAVMMVEECAIIGDMENYEVNLDRPFVYAIIDTQTNTPVFIGTVCNLD